MNALKKQLLELLAPIEGLSVESSPVAGGTALFFGGREFAHFHHDQELDLRLTRKFIAAQGLSHPAGSVQHPARPKGSPWIELRFTSPSEVQRVAELVKLAIAQF